MKKCILILMSVLVLAPAVWAHDQEEDDVPYVLGRGISNLGFGWIELPRGIVYENARLPIIGFISGALKGSFLTVWREMGGAIDILSLGLDGPGIYLREMPDLPSASPWMPPTYEQDTAGSAPVAPESPAA